MTDKPKSGSWRKTALRLLLALCVLVSSLEVLSRIFLPDPYVPSHIRTSDQRRVPTGEILQFVRKALAESRMDVPRGRLLAGSEFRLWYDRPSWDYFDDDGCVTVRINSLGFRDEEFPASKPDGEYRVLAVGDSFTFGLGVQGEDTWPQQLEGMLADVRGGSVEVINAGFAAGSHYPPGYVGWIGQHGLALDPDVVVIGLCLNDLGDPPIPMLWYDKVEVDPWLGGASAFLKWVQTAVAQRHAERAPVDIEQYVDEAQQRAVTGAVLSIREDLDGKGIRLIVAIFPMLSRLEDYPYQRIHDAVAELCDAKEIEHLDLLDRFRGLDEYTLWVHPTDQHPNHVGQRLIAEGIRDYLKSHPR
ncbi:MAG: SGNH/GDSL hydrolase family protein [Planctomycetes bacterium]|nr:SGNH/GDSL hydrolase family protein [Planctomycetota bacterium]